MVWFADGLSPRMFASILASKAFGSVGIVGGLSTVGDGGVCSCAVMRRAGAANSWAIIIFRHADLARVLVERGDDGRHQGAILLGHDAPLVRLGQLGVGRDAGCLVAQHAQARADVRLGLGLG